MKQFRIRNPEHVINPYKGVKISLERDKYSFECGVRVFSEFECNVEEDSSCIMDGAMAAMTYT